jgi:hypothetical protein
MQRIIAVRLSCMPLETHPGSLFLAHHNRLATISSMSNSSMSNSSMSNSNTYSNRDNNRNRNALSSPTKKQSVGHARPTTLLRNGMKRDAS